MTRDQLVALIRMIVIEGYQMSTSRLLFCRLCSNVYASSGDIPAVCPACRRGTTWSTTQPYTAMKKIVFTEDDRLYLRGIHIKAED